MRVRRVFSGLLLGLGCAAAFVGLMALVLPAIGNQQLQLVLDSFSAPSENGFVRLINQAMSFAFAHALPLMVAGLLAAVTGGLLLLHFWKRLEAEAAPFVRIHHAVPDQPAESEPNPFAAAVSTFEPAEEGQPQHRYSAFPPILEQNPIEAQPSPYARPAEPEPPAPEISPAPVAIPEVKSQSPSGSRLLIRSPQPQPEPVPIPEPEPEPIPQPELIPEKPFSSSRIRSTMGKHTL